MKEQRATRYGNTAKREKKPEEANESSVRRRPGRSTSTVVRFEGEILSLKQSRIYQEKMKPEVENTREFLQKPNPVCKAPVVTTMIRHLNGPKKKN
ncbi:hypothetical protein PoB_001895000 [Plakobranchus ocellatus]|uniref:Uncharacterized protein n=1 Tax=Plakobranchus ocellatus TaxID=259542 RepID=A0AAV3ZBB5_9GAST|nr:hypothetical protein PoB_001895000 [Plakobranchus ocellatus]